MWGDDFLESGFDAEIDLTPLIDVVFLLLLFFILVASFSSPVLQVTLPSAKTAVQPEELPDRLVLTIDATGQLHHGAEPITLDAIPALLSQSGEGPVELRVDRVSPFDAFATSLDKLREEGRYDVHITTQSD